METEMINDGMVEQAKIDMLANAGRVFDYFDEHPGVGMVVGGALAAGGIVTMIVYGARMLKTV